MRVPSRVTILLLASWLGGPGTATHGETLLRWKLRPESVLQVDFQQQMKMATALAGQELQTEAELGILLQWQVQSVSEEGTSEIRQIIKRVRLGMTTPGVEPVVFDSGDNERSSPIAERIAEAIKPLFSVQFIQQMDAQGRIQEVKLSDESAAATANGPAAAQLNQVISQDGLRDLLSQAGAILPDHAVNPGDQWTGRAEVDSPVGTLLMDIEYTYRGAEEYNGAILERIDVAVRMCFDDEPNAMGMKVEVADQECSGVVYFDNQHGHLAHSKIKRRVVTEMQVGGDQTHRHVMETTLQLNLTAEDAESIARPPTVSAVR